MCIQRQRSPEKKTIAFTYWYKGCTSTTLMLFIVCFLYIYIYTNIYIYRLCMWRQWIHILQILQQKILKGGMFTEGHSWVANAYSRKYLSICLTLNFKLYWVSRGSKHVLKNFLVSYNKKLTIVCPDVRPYA